MVAIDPDFVEKLKISGLPTDADGTLQNRTSIATDNITADQTGGLIKAQNITTLEGAKATWNSGHGDLANGDTISVYVHSLNFLSRLNGMKFSCIPYITTDTVDQTPSNWLDVTPVNDAFSVFTMDTAFRAALIDLGSGKFSVRIILSGAISPLFNFGRWSEIDGDLTQPGGGNTVQGDPDDMIGVALFDAFSGVLRDSGVAEDPGGLFGTADVSSQGGVLRSSGIVEDPGGLFGTSTTTMQGGVLRDSGVVNDPGGIIGTATVPLVAASLLRGGETTMTGSATVLASGQKVGATEVQGNPEEMFGTATVASAGGVVRDSGVVSSPGGPVGTATVSSQGGVLRDSGTIDSPDGVFGTATVASQGGALRDSGVAEDPGGLVGVALVSSSGAKLDEVLIDGLPTRPLEEPFESITLISDSTQWWIL